MDFQPTTNDGQKLISYMTVSANVMIMKSRGGTIGSKNETNRDYSSALRLILERIEKNKQLQPVEIFVDSAPAQNLPQNKRMILSKEESINDYQRVFTLISRRMQSVGKPEGAPPAKGNANKRLKFVFPRISERDLIRLLRLTPANLTENSALDSTNSNPDTILEKYADLDGPNREPNLLSIDDRVWCEGSPRLVAHLTKERAPGLAAAKKEQFRAQHGRLFCEKCLMDPVKEYGSTSGEACIEIHHSTVRISQMAGKTNTRLSDLQCLCANCHRYIHREMKGAP